MQIPDVTGFTLGEALNMLKTAGIHETVVRMTTPPRQRDMKYDMNSRVVRQRTCSDSCIEELTVCSLE